MTYEATRPYPLCRWAILGAADIARKNWLGILNAPGATLIGVASRDRNRCERFIADCQAQAPFERAPTAFASYEELLASDQIDAVYMPLPTRVRKDWAIRAARRGKHVLSEKPVGCSVADVEEILAACREHRVQFMDGVMFMHSLRLESLRKVLDDPQRIGTLKRISSQFSFPAHEEFFAKDIRMHSGLEPLGCLGDLGWYNVRLMLWAMQERLPRRVRGQIIAERGRPDSPSPVPIDFAGQCQWPDEVTGEFYCSFTAHHQQWAHLAGTRGAAFLEDFVLPYHGRDVQFDFVQDEFRVEGCDFQMRRYRQRYSTNEPSQGALGAQESTMFATFSALALSGQPDERWAVQALATQRVVDACLASARNGETWVEI